MERKCGRGSHGFSSGQVGFEVPGKQLHGDVRLVVGVSGSSGDQPGPERESEERRKVTVKTLFMCRCYNIQTLHRTTSSPEFPPASATLASFCPFLGV